MNYFNHDILTFLNWYNLSLINNKKCNLTPIFLKFMTKDSKFVLFPSSSAIILCLVLLLLLISLFIYSIRLSMVYLLLSLIF